MQVPKLLPIPDGTKLIDAETREEWLVAYCEAVARRDAFGKYPPIGPFAYGCVQSYGPDQSDERVVYSASISAIESPAVILPIEELAEIFLFLGGAVEEGAEELMVA